MPKVRVHSFAISLDGYECVELVSSPSVVHVRLARQANARTK
jgi:hypothetical protein